MAAPFFSLERFSKGIKNPDGSLTTEFSMTLRDPRDRSKWVNIPSVFNGRVVTPQEAVDIIFGKNKGVDPESGQEVKTFKTAKEAVRAAKARSNALGKIMDIIMKDAKRL